MNAFLNSAGRLRSGWRFAVYFLLAFIGTFISIGLLGLSLVLAFGRVRAESLLTGSWPGFIVNGVGLLLAAFLVGWGCAKLFEKLRAKSLGWALHRGWWMDLLLGSVVGGVTLLLAAALAGVVGGYKWEFAHDLGSAGNTLLFSLVVFMIAAAGEEAMFRGYGLQTMARANLAGLGLILTSLLFASVHLGNPNVSLVFTFTNTFLAGVWLGVGYLKTRSLWFALGLHWSWNWVMGSVLGIEVSGITAIAPNPLLHLHYAGSAWLNGGSYGLEGGLACTVAIVISTLAIWRLRLINPSEEMLDASPVESSAIPPFPFESTI